MARRPNQVSMPNPEFGVDFDASARAMHQSASKGSLMVHETAFSMPAAVKKSFAATLFERNTMLKTLKRKIALVAVTTLGATGLAVVVAPVANAAAATAVASSGVGYIGRIGLDADASGTADASYVLATVDVAGLTNTAKDDSIALQAVAGPAGGSLTIVTIDAGGGATGISTYGANNVTVGGAAVVFNEGDQVGAAGSIVSNDATDKWGTTTASLTISGTANLPGVYKLRIGTTTTVDATITIGTAPTTLSFDKTAYTSAPSVSANVVVTPKDSAGRTTLLSGTEAIAITSSDVVLTVDSLAGSGRMVATGVGAGANGVVAQTAATGAFTLPVATATIGTATLTFDSTAGLIVTGAAVTAQATTTFRVIAASLTEITSAKITNTATIAGTAHTNVVGGEVKVVKTPTDGIYTLTGSVGGLTPGSTKQIRIEQTGLTTPANASTIVVTADDAGVAPISIAITGASNTDSISFGVDVNAGGAFDDNAATTDVWAKLSFANSVFTVAGGTTATVPSFKDSATLTTIAARGASASVSITVADQFGNPGAAYLFRATSDDAVVRTVSGLTGLDGKASLTLAAPTDATDTSVAWTVALLAQDLATPVRIANATDNGTLTISYTAAGKADSIVLTGAGTALTSAKTVPHDGQVSDEDTTMTATVYQGGSAITGAVVTVTAPTGCFVAASNPATTNPLLATNLTTLSTTSGTAVFMWCNKVGASTFTFESNGVTKTQSVTYASALAGARDISLTTKDASVMATVTDMFGNGVAGASVIFTRVGNAVFAGGSTVITVPTGADGTAEAILQALGTGGEVTVTGTHSGNQSANAADTPAVGAKAAAATASVKATVSATTGATATDAAVATVKADVTKVSDSVKTLQNAVSTIQASVSELTSTFTSQIKTLSSAIAKISRAIAALSKRIK